MPRIAKVVVDLAVNREFDYLVPERLEQNLELGTTVVVPFGRSEKRGYVVGFSESSSHAQLKEIKDRVGDKALVEAQIIALARWMADYYDAPIELALRAVLPSAVRRKGAKFKEQLQVHRTPKADDEEAVALLRKKAPKQVAVLDYLKERGSTLAQPLVKAAGTTTATLRSLERKGFVLIGQHTVVRDPFADQNVLPSQPLELMPEQAVALKGIIESIETLEPLVTLLFGVTGSGKTEVYLQAIQHIMEQGKGAIVLVPEIALTPQTVERFRARFGEHIAVLHSNLSDGERHDEWHRIHDGQARIVVGARSALFAPIKSLGIIIVDEEHEPTYKQEEAPRYNARDVAVMRGHMERCAVVLGSATPSIESYYNAQRGKYALAKLTHRVDHRDMPAMRILDMRGQTDEKGKRNILSQDLVEAIRLRLARAEQTLLFLNRRGFSSSLICKKCGYVAECEHCSVAMTFHKKDGLLRCHICGAAKRVPAACPNIECRDPGFRYAGTGTQRIEDIVGRLFKGARVKRMDSDTMTRKDAYRLMLGDFKTGKIDILIGTQMIAKGLHFPNVTLVGVIHADMSLHIPDFRAGERTFQLLTQVAGRAGRGEVSGEVIVQTYTPFHPAVQAARKLDYYGFCDQELEFRRELKYPPFTHMTCVTLRGPSEDKVAFSAETLVRELEKKTTGDVIIAGPSPAPLARAKGFYRYQVMLRAPTTRQITLLLQQAREGLRWPEGVLCSVDVDAMSLL